MPIVEIQALVRESPDLPALLGAVSRATAEALECDARSCWVVFREIAPGAYLEGGRVRGKEDANEISPIVTIRAYRGRTLEQKGRALAAVAAAVGGALGLDPALVFVEYREIPEGHVFTGGLVR